MASLMSVEDLEAFPKITNCKLSDIPGLAIIDQLGRIESLVKMIRPKTPIWALVVFDLTRIPNLGTSSSKNSALGNATEFKSQPG